MDLIKKKLNQYIMSLIEKEEITPEEYAILVYEYERRKEENENRSNDTIMRIFRTIN
jgi:hypothetical protein